MQPPRHPPSGIGDGPCLAAWTNSSVVRSDDLSTEQRWPTWSRQAVAVGVRSVLSAPLEAGGASWGAMKVYADSAGAYDERAEDVLRRFAEQTAIFVSNVSTARSVERIGDRLKETLRAREVIATATGIVMARRNVDSGRAYRHLVSLARSAHLPLRQLADRMVAAPFRTSRN